MESERIDDDGLWRLVEAFYALVRADEELGPIFDDAISDWPEHLGKLTDFWSSVMLTTGRYKGQPVPAHMKHRSKITPELFERWLGLWAETTDAMMEPAAARALQDKARRIAQSLQLAMFFRIDADRPTGNGDIPERVAGPRVAPKHRLADPSPIARRRSLTKTRCPRPCANGTTPRPASGA